MQIIILSWSKLNTFKHSHVYLFVAEKLLPIFGIDYGFNADTLVLKAIFHNFFNEDNLKSKFYMTIR